jgi:hypothetical protein
MKARAISGFSLIELCIGASLLVIVLLAVGGAHGAITRLVTATSTLGTLQQRTTVAMEKISCELKWAEADSLLLTTEQGCSRLDFRVPLGFTAGGPVWSAVITYKVVPATGDANGNGMKDEYRLIRQQNGTRDRTVCNDVRAGGFVAARTANNMFLTLRVERRGDGKSYRHEATTSVTLRN